MAALEDAPTDREPAAATAVHPADRDGQDQDVRADVGGWISGPSIDGPGPGDTAAVTPEEGAAGEPDIPQPLAPAE